MLNAFVWMFKTKCFKTHFVKLYSIGLGLYILAFLLVLIRIPEPLNFYTNLLAYVLSILPTLYTLGYFFNLVYQVINREADIESNNIYNGKIKDVYKITLPETDFFQNVWRGIASVFALVLLLLPFAFVIKSGLDTGVLQSFPPALGLIIILFLALFLPALLWNYAKRHSVVAVWNLRKAVYLMGNYTGKYVLNTFFMALIIAINYYIDYFMASFLPTTPEAMASLNAEVVIVSIVIGLIFGVKYLYFTFVNAYLLGTLAPVSES